MKDEFYSLLRNNVTSFYHGPFDTLQEARDHCAKNYNVQRSKSFAIVRLVEYGHVEPPEKVGRWIKDNTPHDDREDVTEAMMSHDGMVDTKADSVPRLAESPPWEVTVATFRKMSAGSAVKDAVLRQFYSRHSPEHFRLRSRVTQRLKVVIPEELNEFYAAIGDTWVLLKERAPEHIRSYYYSGEAEVYHG